MQLEGLEPDLVAYTSVATQVWPLGTESYTSQIVFEALDALADASQWQRALYVLREIEQGPRSQGNAVLAVVSSCLRCSAVS